VTSIRLSIRSQLANAPLLGQAVHAVCEYWKIDEETIFGIELCVVEGVTNAIKHAYNLRPENEVTVMLSASGRRIEMEVSDNGFTMPAANAEALRKGSSVLDFDAGDLSSVPEHGMGLQIIHTTMDEVGYTTEGNTNRLLMVKFLPGRDSPEL